MDYQTKLTSGALPWPYPVDYEAVEQVSVDVLVIGGGLAGCCAAISAAERGACVAVVDKGPIKRSGSAGAGIDHWNIIPGNPKSPMSAEEFVERSQAKSMGLGHRDYIAVRGTWDALLKLEELGLPVRDKNGEFQGEPTRDADTGFLKAYDYKHLMSVKLRGGNYIKPVLYNAVKQRDVGLYERIMVTALLKDDRGCAAGALGFSMETGCFYVFRAKSVVISTGYVCSCWIYSTEITGNSYRWDPNEVGEGLAMAWNAGAEVYGMDKAGSTNGCHPFAWPRFGVGNPGNTWYPCNIVDNNGKPVPWEYASGGTVEHYEDLTIPPEGQCYMMGGGGEPPYLIHDLGERIRRGEFALPLWADLAGVPEAERRSIWGMMIGNEGKTRFTLYDTYTRLGFDPDQDMLMCPIMEPESYLKSFGWFHGEPDAVKPWRSERGGQGEIAVDWDLMTSIPGLFCAGAASGLEGASYACSSGFYAGERAVEYAEHTVLGNVDDAQILAERERVYAPVKRWGDKKAYVSWKELWGGTARVMQQCCGEYRTIPILECGLTWLQSIQNTEARMTYARNPHELARVLEGETRITCSEVFLRACIEKLRGSGSSGMVFIHQENGRINLRTEEDHFWLKGDNRPTYEENYRMSKR